MTLDEIDKLAADCNVASEQLDKLITQFATLGWDRHASYIQTLASHLNIYAHQLRGKVAHD